MGLKRSHYVVVGCLAAGAVVAAIPLVWLDGGYAELTGWGTTRGLTVCKAAAEVRSFQSGTAWNLDAYVAKCHERHERPVHIIPTGSARFLTHGSSAAFEAEIENKSKDIVITRYEIAVRAKGNPTVVLALGTNYRWVVPGGKDVFFTTVQKMFAPGTFEWDIVGVKGVKVAY
jgi:hypothetical protein